MDRQPIAPALGKRSVFLRRVCLSAISKGSVSCLPRGLGVFFVIIDSPLSYGDRASVMVLVPFGSSVANWFARAFCPVREQWRVVLVQARFVELERQISRAALALSSVSVTCAGVSGRLRPTTATFLEHL
jgi:hypothetical protein